MIRSIRGDARLDWLVLRVIIRGSSVPLAAGTGKPTLSSLANGMSLMSCHLSLAKAAVAISLNSSANAMSGLLTILPSGTSLLGSDSVKTYAMLTCCLPVPVRTCAKASARSRSCLYQPPARCARPGLLSARCLSQHGSWSFSAPISKAYGHRNVRFIGQY